MQRLAKNAEIGTECCLFEEIGKHCNAEMFAEIGKEPQSWWKRWLKWWKMKNEGKSIPEGKHRDACLIGSRGSYLCVCTGK